MPFSPTRRPCCISQSKGTQLIVVISCVVGTVIILLCLPIIFQIRNSKDTGLPKKVVDSDTESNGSTINVPNNPNPNTSVYLGRKITAFAIVQILSSLCLLNSKRFKPIAKIWVIFQTITVTAVLIFLWNIPLPLPSETRSLETKFQRFSRYLFTVLGINVCLTIFLILVLVEFIIHPEKKQQQQQQHIVGTSAELAAQPIDIIKSNY